MVLNCVHFFFFGNSLHGREIVQTYDLHSNQILLLVSRNEHFFWPGMYEGYKVALIDIKPSNQTLYLETISLKPRLFRIKNFLTHSEAGELHFPVFRQLCTLSFIYQDSNYHALILKTLLNEIDKLIELATGHLEPSTVYDDGVVKYNPGRTSSTAWLWKNSAPIVQEIGIFGNYIYIYIFFFDFFSEKCITNIISKIGESQN